MKKIIKPAKKTATIRKLLAGLDESRRAGEMYTGSEFGSTKIRVASGIRISAKNLGQIALTDFCERCFWIKLKCENKLPFQIFPGIFASIDSFTKKVTAAHFAKLGHPPKWFNELGDLKELFPVPHHSKFRWLDSATNILLTGVPDELVRRGDGSLVILDYKTARFTTNQDSLLPLYGVQLNGYAVICERMGLGSVSGLALVYYEPQTNVDTNNIDSILQEDGFAMRFGAKVLPVELALDSIPPLLARVRSIYDLSVAPPGRVGCKDCGLLDGLVEALQRPVPGAEHNRLRERLKDIEVELGGLAFEAGRLAEIERALRRERIEVEGRLGQHP